MDLTFEQLKLICRSVYTDLDELLPESDDLLNVERSRSIEAFERLELRIKIEQEILKFKPKSF